MDNVEAKLDQLEEDGFITVENALTPAETEHVRQRINHARAMGWEEGLNDVGNMWFDSLLDREPDTYAPLVGHPGIRPILEGMMGRQCQLRSFRAHINPGPYLQEWHLDFYGYWQEIRDLGHARLAVQPVGINTTFYFQDNGPDLAHLKFVKDGHKMEPPHLDPLDRPKFESLVRGAGARHPLSQGGRLRHLHQPYPPPGRQAPGAHRAQQCRLPLPADADV